MGSRSGFDAQRDLAELADVIDLGSGTVSAAQRKSNALFNLGLQPNATIQTLGSPGASSVVTTDASGNVTITGTLTDAAAGSGAHIVAGSNGVAGDVKIFPTSLNKGDVKFTVSDQTGNTEVVINTAAMGQATTLTVPDPGGASASFVLTAGTAATATITTLTSTTVNASSAVNVGLATGTAGTVSVFPGTTTTGKTTFTATANAGNTTTNINTAAQAGARTYTVPDAAASASFVMSTGTSTATTATSTELNTISGVTAGTVIASKALVADANIALTGLKNMTFAAGTNTVAPVVMTSGTNLTTASAGSHEFDGTCFYLNAAASSRQVADTEQVATVQGSAVALSNSSTSPQNIFASANDVLQLAASTTYMFECYLNVGTGATSHTTALGFVASSAFTKIDYWAELWSTTSGTISTTAPSVLDVAVSTATVLNATSTATTTIIRARGVIRTNAASTVTPQITFSVGPTGTCQTNIDSFFRIWPIGSNVVAAVGNWA